MTINENIILYDGSCNLCKGVVGFIRKRDKTKKFMFVSLQSEIGKTLINEAGLPSDYLKSVVYRRYGKYLLKSTAVLYIFKDMGSIWKFFFAFKIIPPFIRDFIYKIIVKIRYKFFKSKTLPSIKYFQAPPEFEEY